MGSKTDCREAVISIEPGEFLNRGRNDPPRAEGGHGLTVPVRPESPGLRSPDPAKTGKNRGKRKSGTLPTAGARRIVHRYLLGLCESPRFLRNRGGNRPWENRSMTEHDPKPKSG